LLKTAQPDLICIASFPWLIPPAVFEYPRWGAINLHPSLLPLHRGPTPMFWVYYEDERRSGVTVHRVSRKADSGAILGQEIIELPPGATIQHLYDETTGRGPSLLARVVDEIERGVSTAAPQHEAQATKEPRGQRQKTPTGNRD
jgi:methionyl-tRNA formyltransferase